MAIEDDEVVLDSRQRCRFDALQRQLTSFCSRLVADRY